jgi:hypothetical protein
MKLIPYLIILLLIATTAHAATNTDRTGISRISFDETQLYADDILFARTILDPHTNERLKVQMTIPELGIFNRRGPFETRNGERLKNIFLEIPADAPPGDYLVRITASTDTHRRVKHRYITIL